MTAATLARELIAAGVSVAGFEEGDPLLSTDGTVRLTPQVHIQVGTGYFGLWVQTGDTGTFDTYPYRRTVKRLVGDIHRAMREDN